MPCPEGRGGKPCTCTYEPCSRKNVCCDCSSYHLRNKEKPGGVFPRDAEAAYDRSFQHFARLVNERRI